MFDDLLGETVARTMRLRDGLVASSCLADDGEALGEMRKLIVSAIVDTQLAQASLQHHDALCSDAGSAYREALALILGAEQRLLSALLEIAEVASGDHADQRYALDSIVAAFAAV